MAITRYHLVVFSTAIFLGLLLLLALEFWSMSANFTTLAAPSRPSLRNSVIYTHTNGFGGIHPPKRYMLSHAGRDFDEGDPKFSADNRPPSLSEWFAIEEKSCDELPDVPSNTVWSLGDPEEFSTRSLCARLPYSFASVQPTPLWQAGHPKPSDPPLYVFQGTASFYLSVMCPGKAFYAVDRTVTNSFQYPKLHLYTAPVDIRSSEYVYVLCEDPDFGWGSQMFSLHTTSEEAVQRALGGPALDITTNPVPPRAPTPSAATVPSPACAHETDRPFPRLSVQVIIYDSSSRGNFLRRMPKTVEYLRRLNATRAARVFDFERLGVFGWNSPPNYIPLLTGLFAPEDWHTESLFYRLFRWLRGDRQIQSPFRLSEPSESFLWSVYQKLGYVTMYSEGTCLDKNMRIFGITQSVDETCERFGLMGWYPFAYPLPDKMKDVDHFFSKSYCLMDGAHHPLREKYFPKKLKGWCFGSRLHHEQTYNYLLQYHATYANVGRHSFPDGAHGNGGGGQPGVPRFGFSSFQEPHEPLMQVMGTMDRDTVEFLQALNTTRSPIFEPQSSARPPREATPEATDPGADEWPFSFPETRVLNDTILLLMGDHGINYGSLVMDEPQGWLEHKNPAFFMVLPQWVADRYPCLMDSLTANTQRLITHMDVHTTLMHMHSMPQAPSVPNSQYTHTLFSPVPEGRTCKDAFIPSSYCMHDMEAHTACWEGGAKCELSAEWVKYDLVWDAMVGGDIETYPSIPTVMRALFWQRVVDVLIVVAAVGVGRALLLCWRWRKRKA